MQTLHLNPPESGSSPDKRRSVELALAEWPKLSDRELARICAVDHAFVGKVRGELVTVTSSTGEAPQLPATRIGADGNRHTLKNRFRMPSDGRSGRGRYVGMV